MQIPDIVYRIVAIGLAISCGRKLWFGLVERKIRTYNPDLLNWSSRVEYRDVTPVRYWIEIAIQTSLLAACLFVAIFGWWRPNA